jgi:hypothetical protein
MSRELVALTQYAITHVSAVQTEYNFYVKKWERYLDLLADAHTAALERVQNRFKKIRQEQEEARRNVMMAMSVIGVAGAAWLGAGPRMRWTVACPQAQLS